MSNKTSDKNVGSIEDVKEHKINLSQKQSIELLKDTLNKFEIRGEQLYLLKLAIKNLLAEREQKDKRIKELEEESRKKSIELICYQEELENSIPTQVVIDKIKENSNIEKEIEEKIKEEENSGDICREYIRDLKRQKGLVKRDILTLQELLEGEK